MTVPFYQYFQILALLSCLIFYKDVRKQKLGAFLPLCILVCAVELLGANAKLLDIKSDHFIRNLYIVGSTILYFYIYFKLIPLDKKLRRLFKIISFIIIGLVLANYFFFQGPTHINTLSVIFQQLFTILLSCGLLFSLSMSEKYFVLFDEPTFWIAAGLLIFSLGTIVIFGLYQYIRINHLTIKNRNLYSILMPFLNIILYSSYTYAFYLCSKKKKLFSPLL
ncbi:MAG: hypothetical protein ABIP35_05950 [Ginsengibacter sp.]